MSSKVVSIRSVLESNKDYIIEKYKLGVSTTNLGKEFECNRGSIYQYLKEWNVITEKVRKQFNENDDIIYKILELFDNGHSTYQISNKLGINRNSVQRYIKKSGRDISFRSTARQDPLKNHSQEIIKLYNEGLSCEDIAEIYDAGNSSVWRLLSSNDIKLRPITTYKMNEEFFDCIDDQYKAYSYGFFMGDGNNKGDGIRIQIADKDVLEKIKSAIQYNGPIHFIPRIMEHRKDQYLLTLSRKYLSDRMTELGCPPAKSHLTKFPTNEQLPYHLIPHFLRGIIDSDGCIYKNETRRLCDKPYWNIQITGNADLLQGIEEYVNSVFNKNCCWGKRYPDKDDDIYQWK